MRYFILLCYFLVACAAVLLGDEITANELHKRVLDPCVGYKILNSTDRRVGHTGRSPLRCDQPERGPFTEGWYRFTGAAGDRMPTKCPAKNRCGTHAPGWLQGVHPTVAQGIVSRKVCYHWSSSCCNWSNNIKVKNCGAFYVYELKRTPVCWLRYCGIPNECEDYEMLNQPDRAMGNTDQSRLRCDQRAPDNIVDGKWHRLIGNSGTKIPDSCVPMRRCGTHAPGWLNGTHPQLQEGQVNRKVCYHWSSRCCNWQNNIKVRSCGDFYVYNLIKPPHCWLRYCGDNNTGAPITLPTTLPPPTTTPALDPCNSYKLLNNINRRVGYTGQSPLGCDQPGRGFTEGWYRFTGAAGVRMPTKCPAKRRCGTHAPGWLEGGHPTVAQGIASRKVCYHWSSGCCQWSNYIRVRNCGAFYVYELKRTPACSLRYCGIPNECEDYETLNQPDRAMGNTDQSRLRCDQRAPDNIVDGKWHRLIGNSGTKIPESCVPMRRCGTHAPGWLNGTHPQLQEGQVNRKVCYHWSSRCCNWQNNIKVRSCGDFYVYNLIKPPHCWLRYCGDNNTGSPITSPPPTTTKAPTTTPAPNPCSNYHVLDGFNRSVANTDQKNLRCDQRHLHPLPAWYRFSGEAGYRMPTSCVPKLRCGTHAPGWLNGSHPSVGEGIVTRRVCYHWGSRCCNWQNDIQIQNCGAFYVYRLVKPPACWLRYCGNNAGTPPPPTTTPPPPTTTPAPNPCSNYHVLDGFNRSVANTDQKNLRCDQRHLHPLPAWYRFTGEAGDKMPTSCVPKRRCGTHAPGWLNGSHPSVGEGIVTRRVCYHWGSRCCNWKNDIQIQNCGAFYVYRLIRTPVCSLRYCGNNAGTPPPPTTTPPPPTTTPAPNPCSNYHVLDGFNRSVANTDQKNLRCDQRHLHPLPAWYRFTGEAGDKMPTSCVPKRRCGTHAPGWLNGSHPSVGEGIVTRRVCYHWGSRCCNWQNDIQIQNCGAFYVYRLVKPPVCWLRYCGNNAGTPPPPTTTPPLPTTTPAPNPCSNYHVLDGFNRSVANTDQKNLRCDQRHLHPLPAWYRFTGEAGDKMPTSCVPKRRCGTHAPGWLNGSHPSVGEGIVTRRVCYHWGSRCCNWKNDIQIQNCGAFYVYRLVKPPVCWLRYCGDNEGLTTTPPSPTSPTPPGVNLTCGKNEMWISIPKYILHGLDREHLRLNDLKCGAKETKTHFILHTKLTECQTLSRSTKHFVSYTNNVLEIPVAPHQIITRVREVEIPFTCYYSNAGVVSSVGLEVKSKKIIFSKKGLGKFVLEMNIFPDNRYLGHYTKKDFPVKVPLRKTLYVKIGVDTQDNRLEILGEECFATPDPDPNKPGVSKYTFIKDGCAIDKTVKFHPTNDKRTQKFSLEAFAFVGDHMFVYMHCRVKICNASDPNSRCAQGCIRRAKRAVTTLESKDDEVALAQGPFMREDSDEKTELEETEKEPRALKKGGRSTAVNIALIAAVAVCVMAVAYLLYERKKVKGQREYRPLTVAAQ
ncbi:hypothetical protein ABFA07_000937 [Porites harrisoni]